MSKTEVEWVVEFQRKGARTFSRGDRGFSTLEEARGFVDANGPLSLPTRIVRQERTVVWRNEAKWDAPIGTEEKAQELVDAALKDLRPTTDSV